MVGVMERAAAVGVDLVVFPELCVTGYSVLAEVGRVAEPMCGPSVALVSDAARKLGVHVVFGFAERDGAHVYDSAVLVGDGGETLAVYRKVNLWAAENNVFTRGQHPVVVDVLGHRVGLGVCYDLEFPEYSRRLAISGAELIVYPSAQPASCSERVKVFLRARALENGVYVCFSNLWGREAGYVFAGGSCIVGPDGRRVSPTVRGALGFTVGEVDRSLIAKERRDNPYLEDLARAGVAADN
jgi:predicted amidohydrolase